MALACCALNRSSMDYTSEGTTEPAGGFSGRSSSRPRTTRCQLPPFLSKTYDLVEDPAADRIVSWNEKGTGFVVWSPEHFSQFLLPIYFKHANFSSFIRQLNTYGFKKSAPDRWEVWHEKFQKGKIELLGEISRRKIEPSIFPTFLKACDQKGKTTEEHYRLLQEENRILQKKNSELLVQIEHYKALESELLNCLPLYIGRTKRPRTVNWRAEI